MSQNWTNEFARSFKNLSDLYQFLGWELHPSLQKVADTYPIFIPRNLAQRIKIQGPEGILAKEFLPHILENDEVLNTSGLEDPIGDITFFKAPQLIHRYKSRALFAPTTICPVHCRYCFRKNELNADEELFQQDFEKTLSYLKEHSEISEIIFTGGDPLTLSNEKMEKFLDGFLSVKSIKDIRFHTRYPVILPERIDDGFVVLLNRYAELFRTISVAVHANHIDEIDTEAENAIRKLSGANIQLLSQTVLLKNINDSKSDLINLFEKFIQLKIRPYYLHHPDRVKGGMHFYTSLEKGRMLYQTLRDYLPGWAIPHYVIDIPGGHGKVQAFNPENTSYSGQLLTKDGSKITLQEPDFSI